MSRLASLAVSLIALACSTAHSPDAGSGDSGARDAGTDGGTDGGVDGGVDAGRDAGGIDAGPMDCAETMESNLPGVRIDFADQPCTFTLAEAAAGIDVAYDVIIDAPLTGVLVRPQDAGRCDSPGPSGLILFEYLDGSGQGYCLCDVGFCAGSEPTLDLAAGAYPSTFQWTGRNWSGPSDTGNPLEAPFPPGDYTLHVSAIGEYAGNLYRVESTFPIHLVP